MGAGRVVALVFGVLVLLLASVLLLGGGALLSANLAERSDGYLLSPEDSLAGPGYALVSERIDLSTGADWMPVSAALGTARIEVTGTSDRETFVGIAPLADATAYLGGVQRTVFDDLGLDSSVPREVSGTAPSGPPTDQDFWTAQASGPGTQQLTWVPAEGDWMLVVMNADGSPGISVNARIGATLPALDGLGWGLLVSGLVCAAIGVLLLVVAIRRPADRGVPDQPIPWQVPAGPQPTGPPAAGPPPAPRAAGPPPGPRAPGPLPPWVPPPQPDRTTAPDAQPSAEPTPKQP
jgi:hypothetical protein